MPEFARIGLRLLGLLLLGACAVCVVLLLWPGPAGVADAMGVSCGDDRSSASSHQCSSFDAVSVLWTAIWMSLIAGLALRIGTRPKREGPMVINLRRR